MWISRNRYYVFAGLLLFCVMAPGAAADYEDWTYAYGSGYADIVETGYYATCDEVAACLTCSADAQDTITITQAGGEWISTIDNHYYGFIHKETFNIAECCSWSAVGENEASASGDAENDAYGDDGVTTAKGWAKAILSGDNWAGIEVISDCQVDCAEVGGWKVMIYGLADDTGPGKAKSSNDTDWYSKTVLNTDRDAWGRVDYKAKAIAEILGGAKRACASSVCWGDADADIHAYQ